MKYGIYCLREDVTEMDDMTKDVQVKMDDMTKDVQGIHNCVNDLNKVVHCDCSVLRVSSIIICFLEKNVFTSVTRHEDETASRDHIHITL